MQKKVRMRYDFKLKTSGEYHDLYLKSSTSLLLDVFENLKNMLRNLSVGSTKISFSSKISVASSFKKDKK